MVRYHTQAILESERLRTQMRGGAPPRTCGTEPHAPTQTREAFFAGIERAVATTGKTRAELLEIQAAQLGLSDRAE